MGLSDQDSCLALIGILFAHLWDVSLGAEWLTSHRIAIQGRDGEKTPIFSSPPFLVCNWSGAHWSPGTCPQNSSWCVRGQSSEAGEGAGSWEPCERGSQLVPARRGKAMRISTSLPDFLPLPGFCFIKFMGNLLWAGNPLSRS